MTVGILIFNEVEVLDFAGPFEVFSLAENHQTKQKIFKVVTIAEKKELITARNGLKVYPDYSFDDSPKMDILLVPGGYGAEKIEIYNKVLLTWLAGKNEEVDIIASVCTGAFLLAEAGIIKRQRVTTHWMDLEALQSMYPELKVIKNTRFIDEGHILTSAGISAGIELSLYIVERCTNKETAQNVAERMEYFITD